VMPSNGGDVFPITYGDWDDTYVRWSPDGSKLAFISNQLGNTEIAIKSFEGGAEKKLLVNDRKYLAPHVPIQVTVLDEEARAQVSRISITDGRGKFYAPANAWIHADDGYEHNDQTFEAHYFYAKTATVDVPVGELTIDVMNGYAHEVIHRTVKIKSSSSSALTFKLKRLDWDGATQQNWVSADLHVHMNYGGTYRSERLNLLQIADGEDLNVVNNLVVNKEQRFPDLQSAVYNETAKLRSEGAVVLPGQEFHTSYWGHRGILGLKDHLLLPGYAGYPNTAAASLYPMNADVYDLAHAQGALVGAVHPFEEVPDPFAQSAQRITDELPIDVALGKLDYIEIVGFSDHKSTAAVWYKLLNLGFKLPAGAGTDATADYAAPIRGQVGFNRVYAWVPQKPVKFGGWMNSLKTGKTFVTNGPLIEFKLGGKMVGSELNFAAPQAEIPFTAKLRSIVPVDHLEVVCNGNVARDLKLQGTRVSANVAGTIPLRGSGWCLLRAWSDKPEFPVLDNYAYATTSPIYVSLGGQPPRSSKDAAYFSAWIDRAIETTSSYPDWNSESEKKSVLDRLTSARAVYDKMR
jgi:TolB protein